MSQKKKKRLRNQNGNLNQNIEKDEMKRNEKIEVFKIIKDNWLFLILLGVGIIAIYFNSLHGDFVSDDYASITQEPNVMNFSYMSKGLSLHLMLTYVMAKTFGVASPIPFHILSLILFIITCILVFILLRLLFSERISMIGTSLFVVLPIHVEGVSWISGRNYLLNTLFVALSLIWLVLFFKNKEKKYIWYLIISAILTFSAESVRSFALIPLSLLYLITFERKFIKNGQWLKWLLILIPVVIGLIILLWPLILYRITNVNSGYNFSGGIFYDPFFQYPTAVAKYLQLLLWPFDLTLYHTMYIFPVWLNWAILINLLVLLIYFFFKWREAFFALGFIFLAASPSMAPVKVSWLVAERYMFLGSIGFCLLLGLIIDKLWDKIKIIGGGILISLLVFYSVRTVLRNIDWQTNHNLWVNTCQVSPNSHNAWNNIGDDYDKLKQYDNAIKGFTQSTIVKTDYADAYHNRANIFFKIGRLDLARDSYMTAIKYSPGLYHSYLSITQIDLMEKRYDLALQDAETIVKLQPNNPQAWFVMGVTFSQVGNREMAVESLQKALQVDPNYKLAKDALIQLSTGVT